MRATSRRVVPEQSGRQQVRLGARNINIQVIGTLPEHARVNGYELEYGKMFTASDDAARHARGRARRRSAGTAQVPPASLVGATVIVKNMPFEVVGIYRRKGAFGYGSPDDDLYIPLGTSRFRITGDDEVQTISVQVARGATSAPAMVEIERVLRREHGLAPGRDNDFTLLDRRQFLATQRETTQILGFLLAGIAGVSLVVGGIGIMNIMLVTVTERTREIGIRKAIGATRGNILRQFLVESVILCLLGGAVGVALGIGVAGALSHFAGLADRGHGGFAAARVRVQRGRRPPLRALARAPRIAPRPDRGAPARVSRSRPAACSRMMAILMILVCDVGGTRTRLALAEHTPGGWQLGTVEEVPTNADVASTVTAFLRRVANGRVQAAAFGGAGAVSPDAASGSRTPTCCCRPPSSRAPQACRASCS